MIVRFLNLVKNLLFTIVLLLILTVVCILFEDYSAMLPVIIVSSVLLLEVAFFIVGFFLVNVKFIGAGEYLVTNDNVVQTKLYVNKRFIYPFKKIRLKLKYKNIYENIVHRKNIEIELIDRIKKEYYFDMPLEYFGLTEIFIEEIIIYDVFGFYSKRISIEKNPVNYIKIPEVNGEKTSIFDINSSSDYVEELENVMLSDWDNDDYEIREFVLGDSLNKIHWKISTKVGEIMVRATENENQGSKSIYFDLEKDSVKEMEDMLRRSLSMCERLLLEKYPFYMVWKEEDNRISKSVLKRYLVVDEKDYYLALINVLCKPLIIGIKE